MIGPQLRNEKIKKNGRYRPLAMYAVGSAGLLGSESQRATVTAEFTDLSVEVMEKLRLRGYERAH